MSTSATSALKCFEGGRWRCFEGGGGLPPGDVVSGELNGKWTCAWWGMPGRQWGFRIQNQTSQKEVNNLQNNLFPSFIYFRR